MLRHSHLVGSPGPAPELTGSDSFSPLSPMGRGPKATGLALPIQSLTPHQSSPAGASRMAFGVRGKRSCPCVCLDCPSPSPWFATMTCVHQNESTTNLDRWQLPGRAQVMATRPLPPGERSRLEAARSENRPDCSGLVPGTQSSITTNPINTNHPPRPKRCRLGAMGTMN